MTKSILIFEIQMNYLKSEKMRKLIFFCLVVFMASCKDKDVDIVPDEDFAPEFVGNYWTNTANGNTFTKHNWNIKQLSTNQLELLYNKEAKVTVFGTEIVSTQTYTLVNVNVMNKDSISINENVEVTETVNGTATGKVLKQKVEGTGIKTLGSSGVPQIAITLKVTNTETGVVSSQDYYEFKKE